MKLKAKKYLMIDGIGALISSLLLLLAVVKFQSFLGIPHTALYILLPIPLLFVLYDFICYFNATYDHCSCLKRIAYANLMYCCLSFGFAIYHRTELTIYGWIYVVNECLVLIVLAMLELKIAEAKQ